MRIYDEAAKPILGQNSRLDLLLEDREYPFAHEAGIFIPEEDSLYITSNQYPHPETGKPHIHISHIQIEASNVFMPNGGINYKEGIFFCTQGTLDSPEGIVYMPLGLERDSSSKSPRNAYEAKLLVTSFHSRSFNSPKDVVVDSDGSIWFTDPVYRYDPATSGTRAIADGFGRPNGICFSPNEKTVYVTDTDWIHGDGGMDDARASSMCMPFLSDTFALSQR
ncbi:hypothetical protein EK21DRAFT_103583 [Setomelanomma holmii]|uniref:SMP-30/Gluconolactonase/LRE-like region domain-containing protein n=1 Tax=Setomelanomma holmii TaxID=210430 RepID=A0A9P4LI45_9PLEO|nr:hypothetical protein EK21DRAFT_103583 [Setomelanomma holmii]